MAKHVGQRHGAPRVTLLAAAASLLVTSGVILTGGSLGGATGEGSDREEPTGAVRAYSSASASPQPSSQPAPRRQQSRKSSAKPSSRPGASARARLGRMPRAVVVPRLGVEASVLPISLEGRALVPPSDPAAAGWWSEGARPGASTGSAVITGHTVHTGGGVFDDLEELVRGDEVVVRTDRGPLAYDVVSVSVLGRGELDRRSAEIFRQSGPGRLVVITCEDWDGSAYLSNVVVIARPAA